MKTENDSTDKSLDLEVVPPTALESMERASIDVQIATAHRYPRSVALFQKRANEIISYDEETAASCVYRRPVGGGKVAEGASVRLAEIVAACWGNVRVSAMIVEQTERLVKCQGFAHDLESNTAVKSEAVEPTVKQNGEPYSEGQRAVVAKACLAKARRDAIFSVIPRAMCKPLMDLARKVAVGDASTLEARRKKAKEYIRSIKVEDARVFAVLNVQGWTDVGLDHLETLTGLRTAIQDQDTTIDEAFPMAPKPGALGSTPGAATAANSSTTGEDFSTLEGAPLMNKLMQFCQRDGVTEGQLVGWARGKLIKKDQGLIDIADNLIRNNILSVWAIIIEAIRKQKVD